MDLTDLLNIELYKDNLKMFKQAWERTSFSLDKLVMMEDMLGRSCDRRVAKPSLMKNVLSLYQTNLVLMNEQKKSPKFEGHGERHSRGSATQFIDYSEGACAPEVEQRQRILQKELKKTVKRADRGRQRGPCSKFEGCSFEHEAAKKGKRQKTKIHRSCFQSTFCWKTLRQKDGTESCWTRRSTSVFQLQEVIIIVMIDNAIVGIPGTVHISR